MTSGASFFQKRSLAKPMPIFRYFAVVGSVLLVLLFVCDAYFGENESNSCFNGSFCETTIFAPHIEDIAATEELRFTRDVTPADRVKEVFGQFVPNEGKRAKR
jgi:hypothetical protein